MRISLLLVAMFACNQATGNGRGRIFNGNNNNPSGTTVDVAEPDSDGDDVPIEEFYLFEYFSLDGSSAWTYEGDADHTLSAVRADEENASLIFSRVCDGADGCVDGAWLRLDVNVSEGAGYQILGYALDGGETTFFSAPIQLAFTVMMPGETLGGSSWETQFMGFDECGASECASFELAADLPIAGNYAFSPGAGLARFRIEADNTTWDLVDFY
jgi:hypothetical protein